MHLFEKNLNTHNIIIPKSSGSAANYLPYKKEGDLLFISGQTCRSDGQMLYSGLVNNIEQGQIATRQCGLNILSQLYDFCKGDWGKIISCSRLTVFIHCSADFTDHAKVADGVSDLMVRIMGDAGKHTRSAVGVASLPSASSTEVDAIFRVQE